MDIERIEYRRGFINQKRKVERATSRVWTRNEITQDILDIVDSERLLELGGSYGNPLTGTPIEYDHLALTTADGVVEIEVFNRGLHLFLRDDPEMTRIHRALSRLQGA